MNLPVNINGIMEVLPHRPPFLFIDKVIGLNPGKKCVATKLATMGEPHFIGHFPQYPVMPGVLIVEALAQTGAFAILTLDQNKGKIPFFAGIDNFRFRKPVEPGDLVILETEILKIKGLIGKGHGRAMVDGNIVAEGELTFALK